MNWRRPSGCADNACPEVAIGDDWLLIRNARAPWSIVRFSRREWDLLTQAIKAGEFDHGADEGGTE